MEKQEEPKRRIAAATAGIAIALLAIVGLIAVPNVLQARKHGNETAAIGALKTIATAESIFREGDKDNNGLLDYGSLEDLARAGLVDPQLGSGTKQGYLFDAAPSTTTPEFLWAACANPEEPMVTGDRYFATNHAAVIFYTTAHGFSVTHVKRK